MMWMLSALAHPNLVIDVNVTLQTQNPTYSHCRIPQPLDIRSHAARMSWADMS